MRSRTTESFWKHFNRLPSEVRDQARQKFSLWQRNPFHFSMHFKEIYTGLWSVRINRDYRALGRRRGDLLEWFWIGRPDEYDKLAPRA